MKTSGLMLTLSLALLARATMAVAVDPKTCVDGNCCCQVDSSGPYPYPCKDTCECPNTDAPFHPLPHADCDLSDFEGPRRSDLSAEMTTLRGAKKQENVPDIGPITSSYYSKPALRGDSPQSTCSLYQIIPGYDFCVQEDVDCKSAPALAKESLSKDGTCKAQGYTVKGESQTDNVPDIGPVTSTYFSKPALRGDSPQSTCSLYFELAPYRTCVQLDVDCKSAPALAKESHSKDGTCKAHGYTVKGQNTNANVPGIGPVTSTYFTKPAL